MRATSRAVAGIEGHTASLIALLEEDRATLHAYRHSEYSAEPDGALVVPQTLSVKATALSWILEHDKTYESENLEQGTHFELDAEFLAAGVRCYVAVPLQVRGMTIGAFFFGTRDPHPALTTDIWLYENIALQLALAVTNARQFEELQQLSEKRREQNVYLREEIETEHNAEGMIGRSPKMLRTLEEINRVACTDATVLITGETGVGKELVARAIHAHSPRSHHPMVKVNCAVIPEGLVESELFGHERGAFTSATSRRIGRFELTHDGVLFLDEVGELPLPVQAKFLRILQDGTFERVGGTETLSTNARIIAASNRDLVKSVAEGTFRSDLYCRLNVFPIHVAPLRERREDIPLLVESMIAKLNRRMGKNVRSIDPQSLEHLMHREWQGNIRELGHAIERGMILSDGHRLTIEEARSDRRPEDTATHRPAPATPTGQPARDPPFGIPTLEEAEREHIRRALRQSAAIIAGPRGAAALLGLKPSTLRSRMKRLGIGRTQ